MPQSNQEVAIASRLTNIQTIANQIPNSKWSVWLASARADGKTSKVPHAISCNKLITIGHDNPSQWVDFNTAAQWLADSNGLASGLGLLIGSNPKNNPSITYFSGLIALDIDNCLDVEGELISGVSPDLRATIKLIQSLGIYIEISPSSKGLRALWLGVKAENIGERWKSFEVSGELYDGFSTRFVTITGNVWKDSPLAIVRVSEESITDLTEYLGMGSKIETETQNSLVRHLESLTDAEIIAKVKMMAQGKGKRLFEGDMADYAYDNSAADLALCAYIAKLTDDLSQVVRVWGLSALGAREKFLTRIDYREQTAQKALEGARASTSTKTKTEALTKAKVQTALAEGDSRGVLAGYVASVGGKLPKSLGAADKILSLDARLAGAFAYDEFSNQVLKLRSLHSCLGDTVSIDKEPKAGQCWSDADTASLTVWLEAIWNLTLKTTQVHEAIDVVARRFAINTVVDALEALKWDGVKRLDLMLEKYFNADDSQDTSRYLGAIGRAWMIGTVARALQPGCKHDHVLTLEGGQGYGKSKAIRTLASAIAPQAYREGLPPLTLGQEAVRSLSGAWIVELAELSFMDRVTTEHIKAFITKESDSFRLPFGRREITVPRTVSFAATTNQSEFVRDTAARRYWVFKVAKPIDIKALEADATKLWAEAVAAYKADESWWLTDPVVLKYAESSQKIRLERNGWDELIAEKVIDKLSVGELPTFRMQAVHLWTRVTGSDAMEFHRSAKSFYEALTRCGFIKTRSRSRTFWSIGESLASEIRKSST